LRPLDSLGVGVRTAGKGAVMGVGHLEERFGAGRGEDALIHDERKKSERESFMAGPVWTPRSKMERKKLMFPRPQTDSGAIQGGNCVRGKPTDWGA